MTHITTLVYRVRSGTASAHDHRELNQWLDENPANKEEYENIKLLYDALRQAPPATQTPLPTRLLDIKARTRQKIKTRNARTLAISLLLLALAAMGIFSMSRTARQPHGYAFQNTPLLEIIQQLETSHNLDINMPVSAHATPITVTVIRAPHIDDLLIATAAAANLTVHKSGPNHYSLKPPNAKRLHRG